MISPVQKIKERLSIEDVVSSYIKLERAGANLKAKCPFHNEKTPSFFLSPERGGYYCFGCGAKGDIFTFVQEFEGLDFRGALKLLADRAGVPLGEFNPKDKENQSEKEKLYMIMEEATLYYSRNFTENKEAQSYLKSRGLEEKTIKDFRIGFAKNDWRELYNYLKSKKFTDKEIELAGLAKKPDVENKNMYDRFRNRIMFPISDSSGRVIAFSGRIFVDDGKSAKYLNSPETPIFSKSSVLYGIDKAKDSIRKNNFSILVEGQMDLILSHQAGFRNTVATSGTALSDSVVSKENAVSNLGLLRRLSTNIVLAFDADKAGLSASDRAGKIALSIGMDVKSAMLPEGVDPADLILKGGAEAWKEAVRNSKHIILFLLDKAIKSSNGDERKANKEIREKILPYVGALDSSIEKSHFLKKISDASGIPEAALMDDLKKVENFLKEEKREIVEAEENQSRMFRKDYIERRLLGIAFWQEGMKNQAIDPQVIFKKFEDKIDHYKDFKEDLVFEAEVFYANNENLSRDVKELLSNIEEEYLNEDLARKMKELRLAQEEKDKDKEQKVLKEIDEIVKKRESIKSTRFNKKII